MGILTLGHGWWWSRVVVGTWAVRPAISAICAKRAISAKARRAFTTLRCCPLGGSPPASSTISTAERLGLAGGATRGLCCGHLGRSSGASQRLGRASFTHAATTKLSGPGVESWCELHVRGGCGHSRSTRRASKLAVGVLSRQEQRPLQRSRVQWRSRGYQGHQVVALASPNQGCALVGLCLSMCEVGVRAGGV